MEYHMRPFESIDLSALAATGVIVPVDTPVSLQKPLADGSAATRTNMAFDALTEDGVLALQNDLQGTIVPSTEVKRAN